MSSENQWPAQLQQASIEQIIEWVQGPELREFARDDLAHELIRRLQLGQEAQVMRVLSLRVQGLSDRLWPFVRTRDAAPWLEDAALWLRLAEVLIQHGVLPSFNAGSPPRTPALASQLRALMDARVSSLQAAGQLNYQQLGNCWGSALALLHRPGISREECLEHLAWAEALAIAAGLGVGSWQAVNWHALLRALPMEDQIALARHGGKLSHDIIDMHARRRSEEPRCDWGLWLDYFAANPNQYRDFMIRDERLIEQYWPQASADNRVRLVDRLVELVNGQDEQADMPRVIAVFERLLADDPAAFERFLVRHAGYDMQEPLARLLWQRKYPVLLPRLLPGIAERCESAYYRESFRALLGEILQVQPALLETVTGGKLVNLLPLLEGELLARCLPQITAVIAASTSKELRRQLAERAAELSPAQLQACGWVDKPAKNLMLVARDVLLAHPDPAAGPLLEKLLASGKLDIGSSSQVEARLEELGLRQPPLGDDPLALLEARVAGVKRFSSAVEQVATPELLAHMAPLSEQAGRVLLQLAASAEEELPPLTFQLLEQIAPLQRAVLAQYLLESWIAAEGDPKRRWALRLLEGNADDRLVDLLFSTIKSWNKPRKQRAAVAVEQMAAIDSPYALMRVQEISESRKFKDMVVEQASACLHQAAKRRDMSTEELFDELTPDFGLADGLAFSIGDKHYRIQLQGDLSLRVVDDKGKASKSVPKPREPELMPLWTDAATKLKTLSAGLKTVIKRQAPRLETALMTGKQWPLARWQRLFLQHPLLQVVGRSLIWTTDAGQSFRIAEDLSLVDVNDDAVEPAEGSLISLWHPVNAADGEAAAWREYLADYELEPLLSQLDAPSSLPGESDLDGKSFVATKDLKVPQGRLSSLLGKLGYRQGAVGDGPSIEDHYLKIDALGLRVDLNHGYFPPWMDVENPVEIYGLQVFDRNSENRHQPVDPASLPPILQASLLDHLQQISALAVAR